MNELKTAAENAMSLLDGTTGIDAIARYIGYLEGRLEELERPKVSIPSQWTSPNIGYPPSGPLYRGDPLFKDSGDGSFTTYTTDHTTTIKNKED